MKDSNQYLLMQPPADSTHYPYAGAARCPQRGWSRWALSLLSAALLLGIAPVNAQLAFTTDSYTFAKDTGNNIVIGTVSATDSGGGTASNYVLTQNPGGRFAIMGDGVIRYVGSGEEDVTLTPSYTLIVRAIEGSSEGLFVDATVHVSVGICDRTPPVQNYIVNNFSSISACTDATAAKLAVATGNNGPNVARILNDITSLKSWDFAGLIDLGGQLFLRPPLHETYGVAIGGMTSLPEGVFTDLNNLDILDVSSHRFSSLPSGVFVGLNNLTHLQLDNQADNILDASPPSSTKTLSSLAAGVFNGLGKLEELNLAYNNLSSWPAGVFNGLSKLEGLNLAYNNLSSLPAGVFNGLSSLTRVDLSRNPGVPFSINLVPQQELGSATEVRVSSSMAAVGITVRWTASGSSASATETDTVAISAGATTSGVITLTAPDHAIFALSGAAFAATQLVSRGNVYDENYGLALTVSSTSLGSPPTFPPVNAQLAFTTDSYTFAKDTGNNIVIGTVSATDSGGGTASNYVLTQNPGGRFAIMGDGVIRYVGSGEEDVTLTPSYTLIVRAIEGSSEGLFVDAMVHVSVGICDRTPQVQNYIVNNFSSISACTDATAAKLAVATGNNGPNVKRILNDITSLKSWDFAGLIDLGGQLFLRPPLDETYGVAIGGMTSLPEGVFTDLNSLDGLDLSSHRFSSLPSGVFVGLNNLTHLQLDTQADNILDASPPSSTKTLSSLAAGVFNGLGKLEELGLAYNNLSSWPAGVFNGLSSLTRVDLSRNPGVPFSINLVPQRELESATEVRVSSSMAAVGITVRWTASGSASATETGTVAISAGATTSGVITLTAPDHAIFALSGAAFAATQLVSRGNVYDENYGLALTVSSTSLGRTPAFIFPHYTFAKDTGNNIVIGTVSATDSGGGTASNYVLTQNPGGRFAIMGDGVIRYVGSGEEDVTLTPSYTLIVRAIEGSSEGLFADATVQVSVGICDRTPPVQNYIVNNFSSISACTDATAAKLAVATGNNGPNVARILNDITSLKSWDFAGLIDLGGRLFLRPPLHETYGVAIGGMTSLPEGVFTDLNNLDVLDVSSHRFSSLPSGVFVGLNNLTHLQLDNQADNILDASPPSSTKTLSSLAAGVFNGLGKLEELNLAYNNLSSWSAGVFHGLSKLEGLNLAYNNLSSLPAGVFNGLSSLTRVDLSRNPGRPFSINLVPQRELESATEVRVSSSMAAVGITVRWTASGSASATETGTVAISAGATTSGVITLTAPDHAIFALSGAAFAATQLVSRGNVYDDNYGLALTVSSTSLGRTPAFIFPHYTFAKDTGNNIVIGTVSATDSGGGTASNYVLTQNPGGRFAIMGDGVIRYVGSGEEDVTLTPSYTLIVRAIEGSSEGLFADATVQVSVGICDRTPPVRDTIRGTTPCAAVTLGDLGSISGALNLGGSTLTALKSVDFAALTKLRKLYLNENDVGALPLGAFAGLTSLQVLNLRGNQLGALPAGVFAGLTSLELLNLYNAGLNSLPAGVFADLSRLKKLWLFANQLDALPADVFAGLTNLELLQVHQNDGAPFPIELAAEAVVDAQFMVRSDFAGPRITVGWEASGGSAAVTSGTVVIAAGTTAGALVSLGSAAYTSVTLSNPSLYTDFMGFALSLFIPPPHPLDVVFDQDSYTFGLTGGTGAVALGTVSAGNVLTRISDYSITAGDGARFSIGNDYANAGVVYYIGAGNEDVSRTPSYTLTIIASAGAQSATAAVQVNTGICARTQQVQEGIVAKIDGVTNCAAVTLGDLGGIAGALNLGGRTLTALKSVDFAALTKLRKLYLNENDVGALPLGAFAGLTSLQVLNLRGNQFGALPAGVFAGLTSLELLNLYNTGLDSLPAGVFADLSRLKKLWLFANQLDALPADVFAGLTNLELLQVHQNDGAPFLIALEGEAVSNGFVVNSDFAGPRITVSWEASGDTTAVTSGTAVIAAGTTASALVSVGSAAYTSVTLSNPALHTSFIGFALSLPSPSFTLAASSLMQKALLANEKPLFDSDHYSFTLAAEHNGSVAAFALGAVSAHDPNGDAVGYALGVDDSGKFRIDGDSGALYYIGDGEVAGNSMALVVSASDGTLSASAAVTITVVASQRVEKRTQMARMVLSQVGHNIAIHTIDALSGRFAAAAHTRIAGRELTLGSWLGDWMNEGRAAAWDEVEREVDLTAEGRKLKHDLEERLRSGGSFLLPLGGAGEGGGLMQNWSIWGRGKVSSFANQASEVSATGDKWDAWSGYLGVDYRTRDDLLIGAAVSRNVDASTAQLASDVDSRTEVGSQLTGVYPYLHWSGVGHRVWGMFGYGWGEAEVSDSTLGESGIETDLELSILAAGTEKTLLAAGAVEIAAKVDAFAVNMKSAAVSNELNATDTGSRRLRALLSGSRSWGLEGSGGKFIAGASFGGRWDAGDVLNGVGLDVGANLHYEAAAMSLKARGRWLVLHSEDSHQWGLDAALRWRPTALNRGLSVVLAPVWGQPEAKPETLWNSGAAALVSSTASTGSGWTPDHTKLSLGYGIGYHSVLVSPFAELEMESHRMGRLRTGIKLDSDRQSSADLQLSVFGERRNGSSSSTETPARWIGFEVRMGF